MQNLQILTDRSGGHQYVNKYIVKVDHQNHKRKVDSLAWQTSMYSTPVHRTVQQYTVHSTQVQSKGWQQKS